MPWPERDVEGLEEAKGLVARCLDPTADVACSDVLANVGRNTWPRVVALDRRECASATRVSCGRRVVPKAKNVSAQRKRNEEEAVMEDKVILDGKCWVLAPDSVAPLLVRADSGLVTLLKCGVVSGECCDGGDLDRLACGRSILCE